MPRISGYRSGVGRGDGCDGGGRYCKIHRGKIEAQGVLGYLPAQEQWGCANHCHRLRFRSKTLTPFLGRDARSWNKGNSGTDKHCATLRILSL